MTAKILAFTTALFFFTSIYFYVKPRKGLEEYKKELDEALHTIQLREDEIRTLEGKVNLFEQALAVSDSQINALMNTIKTLEQSNTDLSLRLTALSIEFNKFKTVFNKP